MRTSTVVAVAVAVVMVVAAVGSSKVSALHTEVPANRLHGIAKSAEGAYAAEVMLHRSPLPELYAAPPQPVVCVTGVSLCRWLWCHPSGACE